MAKRPFNVSSNLERKRSINGGQIGARFLGVTPRKSIEFRKKIISLARQPLRKECNLQLHSRSSIMFHDDFDDDGFIWLMDSDSDNDEIVGVSSENDEFKVGDAVLLKNDSSIPFIGLIYEFFDDEQQEKCFSNVWFSQNHEIVPQRKDALLGEIYITSSIDSNPIDSIIKKVEIVSEREYESIRNGKRSKPDQRNTDFNELLGVSIFMCRRGYKTSSKKFTDVFDWKEVYKSQNRPMNGIDALTQYVEAYATQGQWVAIKTMKQFLNTSTQKKSDSIKKKQLKKRKGDSKQSALKTKYEDSFDSSYSDTDSDTGRRRRKQVLRPLLVTPMPLRVLPELSTPYKKASAELHASAIPIEMPCREEQHKKILHLIERAITDCIGICIYISGTPGTGKTATVRSVINTLRIKTENDQLDEFIFVEINGMKLTNPDQAYALLWGAISGQRITNENAHKKLEEQFSTRKSNVATIVLMDELDQMMTKNQKLMYNFFNWPTFPNSNLIVLAVANTMDLPERLLSNRVFSRLGMNRIIFEPYSYQQLVQILHSRLNHDPTVKEIFEDAAIEFCARKIASVTGDARRALNVCRHALALAESIHEEEQGTFDSKHFIKVSTETMRKAISDIKETPVLKYIQSLPFLPKLVLTSLYNRTRRSNTSNPQIVSECFQEALNMLKMGNHAAKQYILKDDSILGWDFAIRFLEESGIIKSQKTNKNPKVALSLSLAIKDIHVLEAIQTEAEFLT